MSGDLARSLVDAAAAVFPVDPCAPDDRETVVDYDLMSTTEAERAEEINLPEMYSVPRWGPVNEVARAAVTAVLETLGAALDESARHHDALGRIDVAELRGLAAEVKTGEDR